MRTEITLRYDGPPGAFTASGEIAGEPVTTHAYQLASEALHAFGVMLDMEHERDAERQWDTRHG